MNETLNELETRHYWADVVERRRKEMDLFVEEFVKTWPELFTKPKIKTNPIIEIFEEEHEVQ